MSNEYREGVSVDSQQGWGIIMPGTTLILSSVRETHKEAIDDFVAAQGAGDWDSFIAQGYRAEKVICCFA